MFYFIETGRGIQILYEYTKEEILESDFFELPPEGYKKLLESEQEQKWYMLNPAKLNKNYITEKWVKLQKRGKSELESINPLLFCTYVPLFHKIS